jgi:hypothetical protein
MVLCSINHWQVTGQMNETKGYVAYLKWNGRKQKTAIHFHLFLPVQIIVAYSRLPSKKLLGGF